MAFQRMESGTSGGTNLYSFAYIGTNALFCLDFDYGATTGAHGSHTATLIQASYSSSTFKITALQDCTVMTLSFASGYPITYATYSAGDTIVSSSNNNAYWCFAMPV